MLEFGGPRVNLDENRDLWSTRHSEYGKTRASALSGIGEIFSPGELGRDGWRGARNAFEMDQEAPEEMCVCQGYESVMRIERKLELQCASTWDI